MLAHPILVLPCVCENVEGSRSLAVPWIKRNSTISLVNSAKLGKQGTNFLFRVLINYTICDAILVCFLCLPLEINVINCMRNPTFGNEENGVPWSNPSSLFIHKTQALIRNICVCVCAAHLMTKKP